MSSWVTLITNEWRLKLLAFVLAVLMLGAVAFSQNPPTTKSLSVPLGYTVRDGYILINPPSKTTVTFNGLADVIARLNPENLSSSRRRSPSTSTPCKPRRFRCRLASAPRPAGP